MAGLVQARSVEKIITAAIKIAHFLMADPFHGKCGVRILAIYIVDNYTTVLSIVKQNG